MGAIKNKHLKAEDYQQEYNKLNETLAVLGARIEMRFIYLCKRNPNVALYKKSLATSNAIIYARDINPRIVSTLDTKKILKFIGMIENNIKYRRVKNK